MKTNRLVWQLFVSYAVIAVISVVAVTWFANRSLRNFYLDNTAQDLEARARLVQIRLEPLLDDSDRGLLQEQVRLLDRQSGARVTIITTDGGVVADSREMATAMENHGSRPEVAVALTGHIGVETRYSNTLREPMMYVALPGTPAAAGFVVRLALPITAVDTTLRAVYTRMALGAFLVAMLSGLIGYLIARRITRPLEIVERGVNDFARGDLAARIQVSTGNEIGQLAESINRMAEQLDERIRAVEQQRNQEEAIQQARSDFVANVSHELKTPITTIKGFVETLRDGAIDSEEDAERFLEIIARHTDRLNSIIDDLLALSHLEQTPDEGGIDREKRTLLPMLRQAIDTCRVSADARNILVELDADPGLTACINEPLLEQAVVNLIDNAIKYSDDGGQVSVTVAAHNGAGVEIRVQDRGCGIEKAHLGRVFERFYRTDKARSRDMGGTGLGLAIVKHIALVHGGSVGVESRVASGSRFSIFLPE